jgi:TPR repeat protein
MLTVMMRMSHRTLTKRFFCLPGALFFLVMLAGCKTGSDEQHARLFSIEVKADRGDATAQTELGLFYLNGVPPDYNSAAIWFLKAASQGYAEAQWNLGMLYMNGQGVPKNDILATNWLRLAAEQRWPDAQTNPELVSAPGQSRARVNPEELKWYLRAVEIGNAGVGKGFVKGQGMRHDYREAFKWLLWAATRGNAEAQYAVGVLYARGQGTRPDFVEAHKWYNLAAAQGHAVAARARDGLNHRMTAEQIDTAQRRAASFAAHAQTDNATP